MRKFLLVVVIGILIIPITMLLYLGINASVLMVLAYGNTDFASGFSSAKFRAVSVGDSVNEITELLGEPMQVLDADERFTHGPPPHPALWAFSDTAYSRWEYSRPKSPHNYWVRGLLVDNDTVAAVIKETYWD